jgi:hypothetical protein
MPFETFIVETGSDILEGDRKHEQVAEDISKVFERIREGGGQYVTSIPLADKTTMSSSGGHPDGALYIVADMPLESASK